MFIIYYELLVYQCDALLLKKIPDIYFKFDYIGAPHPKSMEASNGGFSLRNVKSMIKACETYRNKKITAFKCPHMHEDMFLVDSLILSILPKMKESFTSNFL